MTNEEWLEELYMLADQIGMHNDMHEKIDEIRKKHKNLSLLECAELAYVELKRKHEEQYQNEPIG